MIDHYIAIHRNYGIIVDTNLLLLYIVGSYNPEFIKEFKRTHKYTKEEYEWVTIIISYFKSVVITPHILAELWNFVEKVQSHHLTNFIKNTVAALDLFSEDYISKQDILSDKQSLEISGVTDVSIVKAAKNGNYLIFTDDLRAFHTFIHHKVNAINLNHLRTEKWL